MAKTISKINDMQVGGSSFDLPWIDIDSNIVRSSDAIVTNTTLAANGYANINLKSILPYDGYDYLCTIDGTLATTKTNNKTFALNIAAGNNTTYEFRRESWYRVTRATTYTENDWGTCEIPIRKDRRLTAWNSGNDSLTYTLYLRKAKRIGKGGLYSNSNSLERIVTSSNDLKPNMYLYGNPTITDGIMTGCSYLNFGVVYNINYVDNYEWVLKFKTPSTFTSKEQTLATLEGIFTLDFCSTTSGSDTSTGYLQPFDTHTGSVVGQYNNISNNTWYWIKITGSGSTKTYSISTNGTSYTTIFVDVNYPSDTALNHHLYLGSHNERLYGRVFNGSIDLNECYCKYNGNTVWKGMDYYDRKDILNNDNKDGEWVSKNVALLSNASINASATSSISLTSAIPNDGYDYECQFRHTVWCNGSAGQYITLIAYPLSGSTAAHGCYLSGVRNITANSRLVSGNFTLKISGSDRNMRIYNSGTAQASSLNLYLTKYRRISKNSDSNTNINNTIEKSDTLIPNVIMYGSPTITDGSIISGFSSSNYMDVPFIDKSQIKEIVVRIKPVAYTGTAQGVIHSESFFTLEANPSANSFFGYEWTTPSSITLTSFTANTWYDYKIVIDNKTKYYYYKLATSSSWTQLSTITDNTITTSSSVTVRLGGNSVSDLYPFAGSIDLAGCYIKNANDEIIWNGMDYKKYRIINGSPDNSSPWVYKSLTAFSGVSVNSASSGVDATVTISDYLPDDVGMYDILFHCVGQTGTTSGNSCYQNINDKYFYNAQFGAYVNTRSSSYQISHKSGYLTVWNRKGTFWISRTLQGANTTNAMYLNGYRKVYTGYPSSY